jgi:hypothetical protein
MATTVDTFARVAVGVSAVQVVLTSPPNVGVQLLHEDLSDGAIVRIAKDSTTVGVPVNKEPANAAGQRAPTVLPAELFRAGGPLSGLTFYLTSDTASQNVGVLSA